MSIPSRSTSGALRGDEFNSVAEQAPTILKLVADYLHMTTGQLRAFAAQGGITSEIMVGALSQGAASVDAQFAQMQTTISGAFTQLKNAVTVFVGSASQATGGSMALAGAISELAMHFGTLVNTVLLLGVARLGAMTVAMVANRAAAVQSALITGRMAEAELVMARNAEASAAAVIGSARALEIKTGVTIAATDAERLYAASLAETAVAIRGVNGASVVAATGLARFGKGLLALAGGWIGVSIAALAGLVLHFHHLVQAEDEWNAKTKATADSMTQAADKAHA